VIALVAAPRGGGDGGPVFFTVPWSPSIQARGQMPGAVWRGIETLLASMGEDRELKAAIGSLSDTAMFVFAMAAKRYDLTSALGVMITRHLMRELGMFS